MGKKLILKITFCVFIYLGFPSFVYSFPIGIKTNIVHLGGAGSSGIYGFNLGFTDLNIINGIESPVGTVEKDFKELYPFFSVGSIFSLNSNQTYEVNNSNYPYWNSLLSYVLSDGDVDIMTYGGPGSIYFGSNEPWLFYQGYLGNGLDFKGYFVEKLVVDFKKVLIVHSSASDEYSFDIEWDVIVFGMDGGIPVPEPSTIGLTGIGFAVLLLLRKISIS